MLIGANRRKIAADHGCPSHPDALLGSKAHKLDKKSNFPVGLLGSKCTQTRCFFSEQLDFYSSWCKWADKGTATGLCPSYLLSDSSRQVADSHRGFSFADRPVRILTGDIPYCCGSVLQVNCFPVTSGVNERATRLVDNVITHNSWGSGAGMTAISRLHFRTLIFYWATLLFNLNLWTFGCCSAFFFNPVLLSLTPLCSHFLCVSLPQAIVSPVFFRFGILGTSDISCFVCWLLKHSEVIQRTLVCLVFSSMYNRCQLVTLLITDTNLLKPDSSGCFCE